MTGHGSSEGPLFVLELTLAMVVIVDCAIIGFEYNHAYSLHVVCVHANLYKVVLTIPT